MFFAWIFKYSDKNLFYPVTEKQDGIFKLVISSSLKIWKENEKKKWNLRNWIFYYVDPRIIESKLNIQILKDRIKNFIRWTYKNISLFHPLKLVSHRRIIRWRCTIASNLDNFIPWIFYSLGNERSRIYSGDNSLAVKIFMVTYSNESEVMNIHSPPLDTRGQEKSISPTLKIFPESIFPYLPNIFSLLFFLAVRFPRAITVE